jgi:hypothetical protein
MSIDRIMNNLAVTEKHVHSRRTESLLVIVAMILAGFIVVTFMTSISIESAFQQKIDLMGLKHALGDKDNDQGKQMEILPCNKEHECQTSI